MHLNYMHPVTSENQFPCARLYWRDMLEQQRTAKLIVNCNFCSQINSVNKRNNTGTQPHFGAELSTKAHLVSKTPTSKIVPQSLLLVTWQTNILVQRRQLASKQNLSSASPQIYLHGHLLNSEKHNQLSV